MAESKVAIYGAIGANVAIAVTKFIVAGVTGSSAMLSEGIHSAVDTFNGVLLLVGIRLSKRPPSAEHPFGHGKELYFWSLIVAVLIFGLGGGVSFFEGVQHIRKPEPMRDPTWNYVVLAAAAVFEGASFVIALREFLKQAGDTPFWQALDRSKDPTTYTVLAEDSAALAGLVVAGLGIYFSHRLDMPELDGGRVGGHRAAAGRRGRAADRARRAGCSSARASAPRRRAPSARWPWRSPAWKNVGHVLSMYVGPDNVLVVVDVNFHDDTDTGEAAEAIAAIEKQVRARFPMIKRLFIEASDAPAIEVAAHGATKK
jgi:divalent metal cation (Fe/Co/Zn/Cd) transporter